MTTAYHTAISTGAAANASTFNTPLGTLDAELVSLNTDIGTMASLTTAAKSNLVAAINELDAEIAAISGGATVSDAQLIEWTQGGDYEVTAATFDADNVITTATVKWPDGSGGTFTTVTKDATWLAINAYAITHTVASKTATQAAVTRDANGNITVKPALTVA